MNWIEKLGLVIIIMHINNPDSSYLWFIGGCVLFYTVPNLGEIWKK